MVGFIRKSGQRRDQLLDTIKEGNDQQLWTETVERDGRTEQVVVLLKPLMVLPDVKTRWDSVFYMFRRLRYLRQVSLFFAPRPCDLLHVQTPSARSGFFFCQSGRTCYAAPTHLGTLGPVGIDGVDSAGTTKFQCVYDYSVASTATAQRTESLGN